MPLDVDALADVVATAIDLAIAPWGARIAAIEARPVVAGRDGRDGAPGPAGAPGVDGIAGTAGRDGVDGIGFDDFDESFDGERTFTRRYVRDGKTLKEFTWTVPYVLDRGVYQPGREYVRGDAVTFGGSLFIAQQATSARPETAGGGWRLAVKRGNEGKPGRDGADVRDAPVVRVAGGGR